MNNVIDISSKKRVRCVKCINCNSIGIIIGLDGGFWCLSCKNQLHGIQIQASKHDLDIAELNGWIKGYRKAGMVLLPTLLTFGIAIIILAYNLH